MYMYMHFYHTLSSFQKRNYCDSSSGEMVMYMHFYQGNPKTRKPETRIRSRKPNSRIGNRNPKPESGIQNPQIKENKFLKFAKIILHSFCR